VTAAGTIIGTLQYMSPEQIQGKEEDVRSDIFSFGGVLFETLTGKRPFQGDNTASGIAAILTTETPAVRTQIPGTPAALDRVIQRCLAKDPDDRLQTARDLHAELKWIHDGAAEPVIKSASRAPRAALAILLAALSTDAGYWIVGTIGAPLPIRSLIVSGQESILSPKMSPNGRKVAYISKGKVSLCDLSQADPVEVADSTEASSVFWSPDSKWAGYCTHYEIRKVSAKALIGAPAEPRGSLRRTSRFMRWQRLRGRASVMNNLAIGGALALRLHLLIAHRER
jgi:eukaryotic-like serine/threonine-protein kinase